MIKFDNDYSRSAHPKIIEALSEDMHNSYAGYGLDSWCERASEEIRKAIDKPNANIHYFIGGTQTNMTVIDIALRSFEGVISADTGHVNVHETGAIEFTRHKVIALPSVDGKITSAQVREQGVLKLYNPTPGHVVEPKMVYISQPTEFGTLYSKEELEAIRGACDEFGFYLFVDGARLSYALSSPFNDVDLKCLADNCDAFYIGGTKCGALFGEAVVILNDELKPHFFSYQKQHGALLAKGWLLGLQFYTLFNNNLYSEIAKPAVKMALDIRSAMLSKGIKLAVDSPTNQQFFIMTNEQIKALSKEYMLSEIETIDESHKCMRLCTAWYTEQRDVDSLIEAINEL